MTCDLTATLLIAALLSGVFEPAQSSGVLAAIRVQGNVATPEAEIIRLAELRLGMSIEADTAALTAARLERTKRFERVEVRQRFASIADPTQIVLVIIVDEGPVTIEMTGDPDHPTRVVRKRGPRLLFLPVLTAEDGYGVMYGARIGVPNPAGDRSRLSAPLTWGGEKRAGLEFEKALPARAIDRVAAGGSISRRTHPFFDRDEDRGRVWARAERAIAPPLHVGATAGWQHVSFRDADDSFAHAGADLVLDTRLDPLLARNAVYARAAWERLAFRAEPSAARWELDGRAYLGLFGQNVLVVRALRIDSDQPLPVYLQPMLGGLANLRGFKTGTAIGDTLTAGSAEVRMPLTSPLNIGKIGVSLFADAGAVYDKGQRFADQPLRHGYGVSLWLSAAFVRLNVAIAHGVGSSTRAQVGGGVSF